MKRFLIGLSAVTLLAATGARAQSRDTMVDTAVATGVEVVNNVDEDTDNTVHTGMQRFLHGNSLAISKGTDEDGECKSHWSITAGGVSLGFGWNMASGDYNHQVSHVMDVGIDKLFAVEYDTHHGQQISLGIGMLWRKYYLKKAFSYMRDDFSGNVAVVEGNPLALTTLEPVLMTNPSSSMSVFSWEVPLIFKQRIGSCCGVFAGPVLNLNAYASIHNNYSYGATKASFTYKHLDQRVATVDIIGGFTYKSIGIIARYNPMGAFKNGRGPKSSTVTLGLTLGM